MSQQFVVQSLSMLASGMNPCTHSHSQADGNEFCPTDLDYVYNLLRIEHGWADTVASLGMMVQVTNKALMGVGECRIRYA